MTAARPCGLHRQRGTAGIGLLKKLYASLKRWICISIALPFAPLDRVAVRARLDELSDVIRA